MLVQMAFMFLMMQQQMALAMCLSYLSQESISQFKPHTSSTSTVPPLPPVSIAMAGGATGLGCGVVARARWVKA